MFVFVGAYVLVLPESATGSSPFYEKSKNGSRSDSAFQV